MPAKLKHKHCWLKIHVRMGAGYVEVRERKGLKSVAALFGIALGVLFGVMFIVSLGQSVDPCSLISAALVTAMPIAITFLLYRPPRVARFFIEERVAQRYRTFFGLKTRSRWFDLGNAAVQVQRTHIVVTEKKDRDGGGVAALGCFLMLLGPLGALLSLGIMQEKIERRVRVYAVTADGLAEPVLLFTARKDADRVASLYEAMRSNAADR